MTRQQKLVDAILTDGKKEAQKLTKKAQKQSRDILDEQTKIEQQFFEKQMQEQRNLQETALSNKKLSQNNEKNKVVLKQKNEILQKVFELTLKQLSKISDEQKKEFFKKVLSNASLGDEVVFANEADKKLAQKLEVFKSKKLKASQNFGKFCGGAIIVSKKFDLDFSFESLLSQKFERQKFEIAKSLF